jgi:hypothetical protein
VGEDGLSSQSMHTVDIDEKKISNQACFITRFQLRVMTLN